MALSIGTVLPSIFRHPTAPAPPVVVPGVLPERDKKYGSAVPLVAGRGVVSGQVVYQGVKTSGSGQAYVNGVWTTLQNRMGVDVVVALCEAPVTSVIQCYRRSGTALLGISAADMVNRLALGGGTVDLITAATATAWSQYVGTSSEGLAHSGTAHVRIHAAHLGDDGAFPETKWEVQGTIGVTATSTPDAEPADFLLWLLTDTTHGLGFSTSMVNVDTGVDGSAASSYRRYTRARGWYLSRVIEQGEKISDIIEQLLLATNSTLVWVDGKYTAVPLDDESSSTSTYWPGHGTYPYTAVTSYVSIGDDDFAAKRDPVQVERQPRVMVPSIFPIEYTLRVNDSGAVSYAPHHAEYQSDVFSSANGIRRADAFDYTKWILNERHAWFVSYLTAQRTMYHRSRYTFRVKPKFGLVAPGDFISLSDSTLGLSGVMCRAETVEEGSDGVIEIEALEWPNGTTKAFALGTTSPVGRWSAGQSAPLATYALETTPPNVVDAAKLTNSYLDKDNLFPGPSSEIAPGNGMDATQAEFADRYNAGAGVAFSGSWVRQIAGAQTGLWLPCSPGALFYFEAQAAVQWSTLLTATPTTGGSLPASTRYYRVVAVLGDGTLSAASNELSATISGGNNAVALTWTAVLGATKYYVFEGASAGGENTYKDVGNVTSWTDTSTTGWSFGSWTAAGAGARVRIAFAPTFGSLTSATWADGAHSTSGAWTKVSVSSAAAPAGTNAVFICYEGAAGGRVWFDALYARRVVADIILSQSPNIIPTPGTGWTISGCWITQIAGIVMGTISLQAGATAAWTSIATLPAGSRPVGINYLFGYANDSNAGTYPAYSYEVTSGGLIRGSSYQPSPFVLASGDSVFIQVAFGLY